MRALAAECVERIPCFESIYEKMLYKRLGSSGRRSSVGITQADESDAVVVIWKQLPGSRHAVWDVKHKSARHPGYKALGRRAARCGAYAERWWAQGARPRGKSQATLRRGYRCKMRVVGRDGFLDRLTCAPVKEARRGLGANVEL